MKTNQTPGQISPEEGNALIGILKIRFEKNPLRHPRLEWSAIQSRLLANPEKWGALQAMENTGGEPDVVGRDDSSGGFIFFDCSAETPKGRVSLCYDRAGLESRKEHPPANSAMDLAASMGIALLNEAEYRFLQTLGEFDKKTSSWLQTPPDVRKLGGALYGERRYGRIFVGHNGAQSYYGARAFRGLLVVE